MSKVVAVAGKGGTGKTTLAALLVRAFLKRGIRPILAVDADPNSNLPEKLGVRAKTTIGDLREDTLDASFRASSGVSKPERLELALQQAIAEGDGIDVLVMGRGEGPGCYCSVNNLLRQFLGKIRRNYERVVIDNEAGMEHLSRRTDGKVDTLLITSDTTPVGLRAAKQVYQLARKQRLAASANFSALSYSSCVTGSTIRASNLPLRWPGTRKSADCGKESEQHYSLHEKLINLVSRVPLCELISVRDVCGTAH